MELKPCPFCGSYNLSLECLDTANYLTYYSVSCPCGARMRGLIKDTKEIVIDKWNRRADSKVQND